MRKVLITRGLQEFELLASPITAHLARESGYSRQHLLRLRFGRMRPSLTCIAALVIATRRLVRKRVRPDQLFDPHTIRAASSDAHSTALEDHQRLELRAAFGRCTLPELLQVEIVRNDDRR